MSSSTSGNNEDPLKQAADKPILKQIALPNLVILNGDRDQGGSMSFALLYPLSPLLPLQVCCKNSNVDHALGPIALGEGTISDIPWYYSIMITHFATYDPAHPDLAASVSCNSRSDLACYLYHG